MQYAVEKKQNEAELPSPGLRGGLTHKTDATAEQDIVAHIATFDDIESRYRRKHCNYEFLLDGLNKSQMYRLYLEGCRENGKKTQKKALLLCV